MRILNAPQLSDALDKLRQYLQSDARNHALRAVGDWTLLNHANHPGGTATLDLYTPPNGAQPTVQITKHPDGTISHTRHGHPHTQLPTPNEHLLQGQVHQLAHKALIEFLLKALGPPKMAQLATSNRMSEMNTLLYQAASHVTHRALANSITPQGPRKIPPYQLEAELKKLLPKHFIHNRTKKAATYLPQGGPNSPNLQAYNSLITASAPMAQLYLTNPALAAYCAHTAPEPFQNSNPTEEDAKRFTQQHLELSTEQNRHFQHWLKYSWHSLPHTDTEAIQTTTGIMIQLSIDWSFGTRAPTLANMAHLNHTCKQAGEAVWQQWLRVLTLYFNHPPDPSKQQRELTAKTLKDIGTTLATYSVLIPEMSQATDWPQAHSAFINRHRPHYQYNPPQLPERQQ